MKKFLLLFILLLSSISSAQLKREFRGVWIASVTNLDFPSSNSLSTEAQKNEIISLFNGLKAAGINAILFQIRSECDALYNSQLEPWSFWLTGQQGKAPSPYYDPLEFAVEEAHKRGIELHAWLNPYRVERSAGNYTTDANHVTKTHPDWIFQTGTAKILDPGKQAVRNHITAVVTDVIRRYDVDGIHFDDYFYPYSPNHMTDNATYNALDDATFASESRGIGDKYDWRRDNINILMKQLNDSIQSIKPYIKFGMSPFGIWKNGVPSGISGMDAYSVIYCDAVTWLQQKTIDYLTPQLYWAFGGSQDYGKLMPWWYSQINGRHLYPGHGSYRITSSNWSASELPNQIRLNRTTAQNPGSVFFRAKVGLLDNPKGFLDSLKNDFYKYIALPPVMEWKDTTKPNTPANIRFEKILATTLLRWDEPAPTSVNDSTSRYVVYRFTDSSPMQSDFDDPKNIIDVIHGESANLPIPSITQPYYFAVTSLDHYNNESVPTNAIQILPPTAPLLAIPSNGSTGNGDTIMLQWQSSADASLYHIQVSSDSTFAGLLLVNDANKNDTMQMVTNLFGETKYYWRVRSLNPAGASDYSSVFTFTTGFPASPLLASPPDVKDSLPTTVQFAWMNNPIAQTYRFQLARSADFNVIVTDSIGMTDTTLTVSNLLSYTLYYWRVNATNVLGTSAWTTYRRFRTQKVLGVDEEQIVPTEFALHQNFPNPFNPTTTIQFSLIESNHTSLKVYDVLGREVAVIINNAVVDLGVHTYKFDASNLPSGLYIYRLTSGNLTKTKKMLFQK